ncbi:hypothetical protein LTLLF_143145 [Microtus ochrogaster]|uniref:Uncharacterized protein n=1 Tax=Microtus ochrogaster TaxID=79684 RepID=A0A8J6GNG0_MICOH|nr:hypothetical protein LTLLF_143145 [Microtus ochrogaster]
MYDSLKPSEILSARKKRTEKRKRSLEQLQSRSASGSNDSLEPKILHPIQYNAYSDQMDSHGYCDGQEVSPPSPTPDTHPTSSPRSQSQHQSPQEGIPASTPEKKL